MRFLRLVILVTTVAMVMLVPTAAQAKSYSHVDPTGDVVSFVGQSETPTPAPDRASGDIVGSSVKHKAKKVIVRVQYRDLVAGDDVTLHIFEFKTSAMRREVMFFAGSVFGSGGSKAKLTKPDGTKVPCKVARRIDYSLHTVTVKVPRSCLDRPKWVQVGMGTAVVTSFGGAPADTTTFVDDAMTNGTIAGRGPRLGPKVFR